ncbi:MAG TPA: hypothetical protein VG650_12035 [Mycobacteriales bacterium]|nr:hypothetical protein [Mycobacteriales bacterium]
MRLGNEQGALGVSGMVKLAVAFAVLGVLGYDTFVTIATHLKAENDAQNAAYAASQAWYDAGSTASSNGPSQTPQTAFQAAASYLAGNESAKCAAPLTAEVNTSATPPASIPVGCDYLCVGMPNQAALCGSHGTFSVDPDSTVHLVVRRQAKTLVFGHLGFMHSLLVAYEHGDAGQGD